MRQKHTANWLPLAAVLLTGCNTTDTLTPQVNVGGGLYPSSPVTQADAQRMAQSDSGPAPRRGYYPPPPGAQNRMQAQTQAMRGETDAPIRSTPLPPPDAAGKTGGNAAAQAAPAAPPSRTTASTATTSGIETIRFLPIIGAPVEAVTPLSRQLGDAARAGGLTIKSSADASATHILKGYLSAFEDGSNVTVVYVWDVLDPAGARLNRIQGQLSTPARGGDPWASVPADLMAEIGRKTISSYLEWLRSQKL